METRAWKRKIMSARLPWPAPSVADLSFAFARDTLPHRMSKRRKGQRPSSAPRPFVGSNRKRFPWAIVLVVVAAAVAGTIWISKHTPPAASSSSEKQPSGMTVTETNLPTNEVAQAIMVTQELAFGGKTPSIEDALKEIERRHEPADGVGRTFAMLDAYGQTNADGKLHISMHLSMEKPGIGSLVFKRTGELLWKSRITPAPGGPPAPKNLTVLIADPAGKTTMLDGSKNATRVLDCPLRDSTTLVRDVWPDGEEREFTFIYSVCGCPVKVKVRRAGESTVRTSGMPVMFPDDPAVVTVINALMGWPEKR
jgi:hypothetical protein